MPIVDSRLSASRDHIVLPRGTCQHGIGSFGFRIVIGMGPGHSSASPSVEETGVIAAHATAS